MKIRNACREVGQKHKFDFLHIFNFNYNNFVLKNSIYY